MKNKSFWISVLVTFVAMSALEFLIHGGILCSDYEALAHLYRPKEQMSMFLPFMFIGFLVGSAALVCVYDRGKEERPHLGQGLRFGMAMALLIVWPMVLIYYAIQPLGFALMLKQLVFGSIEMVALGVLIAHLRKDS